MNKAWAKRSARFTKIYRMSGNGFSLWFTTYKDANEYARMLYKGTDSPWYGRANVFKLDLETGEIK
jgi:hypothetical protein